MIDTKTRMSPGWRLQRLTKKLAERQQEYQPLFDRYEGTAALPPSMQDAPDAAKVFFQSARTTFAEMVVKAVKYPLRLQSIGTSVDNGDEGDAVAYDLFVKSGMRSEVDDVHRLLLTAGTAYAIVSKYEDEIAYTSEDPRQVVTNHDPVRQSVVTEALKMFHHPDDGKDYAYLYVRGTRGQGNRVWRAYRTSKVGLGRFNARTWDWDPEYGGEEGQPLPAEYGARLPVLRYRNEEGVGEFKRHVGLFDRIDHLILQGMVIATMQAFKQRAIHVDVEDMPDEDPETGEEIDYSEVFTNDPGAIWKLPQASKLWESGNIDLTPVWTGVDKAIQQLSAVTFTPLSMFSPDGQNQSAAGASFAREGRTMKVEDRQDRIGDVHALAMSLMFQLAKDAVRADLGQIEIQWRPAERYSLAEKGDALVKYKAGGVPWRTRMVEVAQFTPAQVKRMTSERVTDELLFPAQVAAATDEATQRTSAATS